MPFMVGGHPDIHCQGHHRINSAGHLLFQGPAARIRFRCTGTRLTLHLKAPDVHFDLLLDGGIQRVSSDAGLLGAGLFVSGRETVELRLPGGKPVTIEFRQRSESPFAPVILYGLEIKAGKLLPNPIPVRPRIEFIGDSYFVGYGNLLPDGAPQRDGMSPEKIASYTNAQLGMAARCGELLQMDWRITAVSGRGLVRNYAGNEGPCVPDIYWRDRTTECNAFPADLVVINLGTNDFSTPLHVRRQESFPTPAALANAYQNAYLDFLKKLCCWHDQPQILLLAVPHAGLAMQRPLLEAVVSELSQQRVHWYELPVVPLQGCDGHPDSNAHELYAGHLARSIREVTGSAQQLPRNTM